MNNFDLILILCYNTPKGDVKMQKEILTMDNIQEDVKDSISFSFWIPLAVFLLYTIVCAGMAFCIILLVNLVLPNMMALKIIGIIFFAILELFLFYEIVKTYKNKKEIKKGDIQITEDWVVEKLPVKPGKYNWRPYTLVFAKSGNYGIHNELNYKWSKVYLLSDEGVYNYTKIDDEFYVISVGEHKNLVAYNKRMFELK